MIKCNSCGRDCRIGTEQVGIDNREIPVYHRFACCDNCMVKYDLDIEPEKHHSRYDGLYSDRQNGRYAIAGCILSVVSLVQLLIGKRLPFNSPLANLTLPLSIVAFVLCVLGMEDKWGITAKIGILAFIMTIVIEIFQIPTWLVGVLFI
ncbi:MAG: hypothetical protein K2N01_12705 [Lachnospiraceae bacterium]|nr:hypothetical protein [Lachnospiraceae bacterium]